MDKMPWFAQYCEDAERTDQLVGKQNHVELLAAGLFGEVGSVLAELKKERRETLAYPAYRNRLKEELGDALWYLTRLTALLCPSLLGNMPTATGNDTLQQDAPLAAALALGGAGANLFNALRRDANTATDQLRETWMALLQVVAKTELDLGDVAQMNLEKIQSRWPENHEFIDLFDDTFGEEEQLPRKLNVEFRQVGRGDKKVVVLRCNGLNFGDRLTDNIQDSDFYRFHDIFHFAYATYLGWSPVIRTLLHCKRKSDPDQDENEDGARARIIEEAISAVVFSRAKEMRFYDGIEHVDYDLLKIIQEYTKGFEVDKVPLWQWETAILRGYEVFRSLRKHGGGRVDIDLTKRTLCYQDHTILMVQESLSSKP